MHDWFNFYGREFNVPVIGVQTHRGVGDITKAHIDSISSQIKALVPTLEEVAGKKLDYDEFKRVVGLSRQCTDLWKEVLEIASNVPSPLTFFDGTIQMGPAVILRGEQRAVDYYKQLLVELKQRVKDGVAAIDGEQFRLYWEGMPIWGKLRELSTQFAELNTCVLASTYCSSWVFPALDPDDPFDSMARAYIELLIVRDENYKEKYFEDQINRYKIDGMIFHDAKTCPNNSNNRYGMPERLTKKYEMPNARDPRRSERSALLFGRTGAHQYRGLHRAAGGEEGQVSQNTFFGGVDIGASATKVAIIDGERRLVASDVRKTGVSFETCAQEAMDSALASCGLKLVGPCSAFFQPDTGVIMWPLPTEQRPKLPAMREPRIISFPDESPLSMWGARTTKSSTSMPHGRRENFKMNRKCAAGTGAFLEEVAQRMDVPMDQLDSLARQASSVVHMGSYCTVFTKTEILAHLRAGKKVPEIVAGLIESVVQAHR